MSGHWFIFPTLCLFISIEIFGRKKGDTFVKFVGIRDFFVFLFLFCFCTPAIGCIKTVDRHPKESWLTEIVFTLNISFEYWCPTRIPVNKRSERNGEETKHAINGFKNPLLIHQPSSLRSFSCLPNGKHTWRLSYLSYTVSALKMVKC